MEARLNDYYTQYLKSQRYWGQADWQRLIDMIMTSTEPASAKLSYVLLTLKGKIYFLQEQLNMSKESNADTNAMEKMKQELQRRVRELRKVENPDARYY